MKKIILLLMILATPLFAVLPDEILDDPVLEERAREISKQLRCLVCRSENIDESNSGFARDLRLMLRERLVAGDTDEQVIDFFVDRFGEYVLLKPRFSGTNIFLWVSGPLFLLFGGGYAIAFVRGKTRETQVEALTDDEQKRLNALLGD